MNQLLAGSDARWGVRGSSLLRAALVVLALAAAHGEEPVEVFIAACHAGMSKSAVDVEIAKSGAESWRSLSSMLQFHDGLSADLVAVDALDHLVLCYRPTHDPYGQGNLSPLDELVDISRHRFSDLLVGQTDDQIVRLTAIQRVSGVNGYDFDPSPLIACVNLFQRAGEANAVTALTGYLGLKAPTGYKGRWGFDLDEQRVILIARMLYGGPDHPLPPPMLGKPSPELPNDQHLTPVFPLLVQGDIPFLPISGYELAGLAEPASMHLDICRTVGSFRTTDLVPIQSPTAIVDALMNSPDWDAIIGINADAGRQLRNYLRSQSIRSLRPVLPQLGADAYLSASCCDGEKAADAAWAKVIKLVADAGIHWDAEAQRFTAHLTTSSP